MAKYAYQARDNQGDISSGVLNADNAQAVARMLRDKGMFVVKIAETARQATDKVSVKAKSQQRQSAALRIAKKKVKRTDIIFFAHQLAVMVDTGVPISEALSCTTSQVENKHFQLILEDVSEKVESGENISSALGNFPTVFPTVMRSLIQAGELSGTMPKLLERAARYLVKEAQTLKKLKSALTYPAIMMSMAIGITIFLMVFVLPKFAVIYADRGAALPKPTQLLLAISAAITGYWYYWIAGIAALVFSGIFLVKTTTGRRWFDYAKLNTPVVKGLFRQSYIARSFRTMGVMLTAGVTILDTVEIVKTVVNNSYFAELWDQVDEDLRKGAQLSDTLGESDYMPKSVTQMVLSGEKSGRLGKVIERVADFAEDEFDTAVEQATQYIEPIMILAMGGLIGFVAISLLMPIFSAGSVAAGG